MTDLINKTTEETNILIQKYTPVLEVSGVKTVQEMQILSIIIDTGINYIKEKYNDLDVDWKSWTIVVLNRKRNKLKTIEDVKNIVDEFIEYYKLEYQKYRDIMCEYNLDELDFHFINLFTDKH